MSGLLVHEWIERSGGAERVLDVMANAFPDAGIQCLWDDAPERFPSHVVHETWLAQTPLRNHKALALPFTIPTWRRLAPGAIYEWMLVGSYVFSHHARLHDTDIPKYVYAHTPARYIWNPELDGRGDHIAIRAVAPIFRRIDRRRSAEATAIAANSEFVRQRVERAWEREAVVIHPPVRVERIFAGGDWRDSVVQREELRILDALPREFILGASRFVPYKRLDLVILAGLRAGLPVVIAGHGPEEAHLRKLASQAGAHVDFVIAPSDALLFALIQRAGAFVFPAVEDFGILPVEAQALGTPVVTGPVGGQIETYISGLSGAMAESVEVEHLADAIHTALALAPFDPRAVVSRFDEAVFTAKIRKFVGDPG